MLNVDDPRVAAMTDRTDAGVVTYGTGDGELDVRADDVELDDELRASFRLRSRWGDGDVRLAARGAHQVGNALAAAAAGLALGLNVEEVRAGRKPYCRLDILHRQNLERILRRFGVEGLPEEVLGDLNLAWHRLDPWPDPVLRTIANLDGNQVYEVMNGPNEFTVIGTLKDWDRTASLPTFNLPTLVTVGRYDEITPACAETLHRGIPDSQLHLFENSAHLAHVEEPEEYLAVVRDFLRRVEA